ncbi:MAG: zinc ribbon domain-containing protein [Deltaproteobacteria bacterium]|nr:zinc ribbon domain-containing protein [Deltaproteobacteria bacterium]
MMIVLWIFCPIIAAVLAAHKGRSSLAWFFLGLLAGPFAWAVALLPAIEAPAPAGAAPSLALDNPPSPLDEELKDCPQCAEKIKLKAKKCRYCGSVFDAAEVDREIREREEIFQQRQEEGKMKCPHCGSWEVLWAYTEDGSLGWWCPRCNKSLKMLDMV